MRLFLAIPIPEEIIQKIEKFINELKILDSKNIKWVKPSSIHVTLKFLGEVNEENIDKIKLFLSKIHVNPEKLDISGLGGFPSISNPRVLWIGINSVLKEKHKRPEINVLAKKIDEQMSKIGFKKEKRIFSPHLTIGRVKGSNIDNIKDYFIKNMDTEVFGEFTYNKIALYQSILKPTGAEYKEIAEFS